MIKHIVFITHLENDIEEKQLFLETLKNKIDNLKLQISEIQQIESGLNISTHENAYDFCLIVDFKNNNDLEAYRIHPAHKEVLAFLQQHKINSAVVDYKY